MNINKCIFAGNLTRDPEARTTGTGKNVTNFNLAVNGRGRDSETFYVKCEAWGKVGEIAEQYLRKGSNCAVDGRLRFEEYTTRDGDKRRDVVLVVNDLTLGARSGDGDRSERREYQSERRENRREERREPRREEREAEEQDLPF